MPEADADATERAAARNPTGYGSASEGGHQAERAAARNPTGYGSASEGGHQAERAAARNPTGYGSASEGDRPAITPAPTRRARLGLLLRLVVSAALLALLISKIDLSVVTPRERHVSTIGWLVLALLTAVLGIVLSAWRWQRVIAAFGIHVPVRRLSKHYFAGQFVGNVLPSTIGGDVLRVSRSAKDIGATETAFAAVALERLTGFLALPVLCLLGFALDPSLLESNTAWIALLVSGIALAALGAILFLAGHPRAAGRFRDHENWMRFLGAVHEGVERLRADQSQIVGVLGTAFIYQVSVIATVGFLSLTLGTGVPFAAIVAFIPVVAMAQVVPISLAGLGIREGMLVLLLHPLGVSNGQAIGLGLAWYATMLLVSLLGAPAFAVGHRAAATNAADGRSETPESVE